MCKSRIFVVQLRTLLETLSVLKQVVQTVQCSTRISLKTWKRSKHTKLSKQFKPSLETCRSPPNTLESQNNSKSIQNSSNNVQNSTHNSCNLTQTLKTFQTSPGTSSTTALKSNPASRCKKLRSKQVQSVTTCLYSVDQSLSCLGRKVRQVRGTFTRACIITRYARVVMWTAPLNVSDRMLLMRERVRVEKVEQVGYFCVK